MIQLEQVSTGIVFVSRRLSKSVQILPAVTFFYHIVRAHDSSRSSTTTIDVRYVHRCLRSETKARAMHWLGRMYMGV